MNSPQKIFNAETGFSLVEVIAVLVVFSIILTMVFLTVLGSIERAKNEVCQANRNEFERVYERDLALEGNEHSEILFVQSLEEYNDICPEHGVISYTNGEVHCSKHFVIEEPEEDVPYL